MPFSQVKICGCPAQAAALGQLDAAAKAAAAGAAGVEWPGRRIYRLGDLQLHIACEGALGVNATKMLGALDGAAQQAAVALISGFAAGSGLPELAAKVPCVTMLLP
jgi:hypothetical protein